MNHLEGGGPIIQSVQGPWSMEQAAPPPSGPYLSQQKDETPTSATLSLSLVYSLRPFSKRLDLHAKQSFLRIKMLINAKL